MFDQLLQLDHQLFLEINQRLANPFFDYIMPLFRNRYFWAPLYLFLIVFLVRHYNKYGWICIIFLLITFAISDFVSASLVKPLFERLRPCNAPDFKDEVRSLISCGSGFSFPSSHATNHFAIALFLIVVFYHRWKPILPLALGWAFCVAFAQVYVGVHFPIDVTTGALLGSVVGYITGSTFLTLYTKQIWNTGN
ncbi:putative membrane-associated phospholipid phosphatase [Arcticibacter svalbardensis MN12-7]|uniref:Putative membrane-associated phospholipid phosphatase n=1 Tax=Arcticibacter svalbardensis MN12-7 TaxID=1150600 RepID=R9GNI2_9SPHI|nr:phosphatase PAP2 family protein [Arcticibacter svalbardensis]EOR93251.1 putative membrane-associated phospholipid phosphatase [Arcticibacter svalbardensis MN12-7]